MEKVKTTSTNYQNKESLGAVCMEAYALDLIGTRWKLAVFYALKNGPLRFSELKNNIANITERMLSLSLRELEKDQLVSRTVYPEVPARVEYNLTDSGKALEPVWKLLREWGRKHREMIGEGHLVSDKIKDC
jgi:DNA-binding HxlR family transcriptional regulator